MALSAGSVVKILSAAALSIILARTIHLDGVGRWALLLALYKLISILFDIGVGNAFLTLFGTAYFRKDVGEMSRLIQFYLQISLVLIAITLLAGVSLSVPLTAFFCRDPKLSVYLEVLLWTLVPRFIFNFCVNIFRGMRRMKEAAVISSCFPVFCLVCISLLLLFRQDVSSAVWGYFIAYGASSLLGLAYIHKIGWRDAGLPGMSDLFACWRWRRDYLNFSFILSLDKKALGFFRRLPILFLGALATPAAAGLFKVALGYSSLLDFLFSGVGNNTQAKMAQERGRENWAEMKRTFSLVSLYGGLLSIVAIAVLWFLAPWYLKLLGEEFSGAISLIGVLVLGVSARGFACGVFPFLKVMEWVKPAAYLRIFLLVAGLVLSPPVILIWGAQGAAVLATTGFISYSLGSYLILRSSLNAHETAITGT